MAETANTALQDELLNSITTVQDAALKVVRGWAKTLTTTAPPTSSELLSTPKIDQYYNFAEKLWSVQRDFVVNLLEVATEAGKTIPDQVKRAANSAASNASK